MPRWMMTLLIFTLLLSACAPDAPQREGQALTQALPVTGATAAPSATMAPVRDALETSLARQLGELTPEPTAASPFFFPTPTPPAMDIAAPPAPAAEDPGAPPMPQPGRIDQSRQWGLIHSREGLWAVRPDGSGLTLLTADPIYEFAVSRNKQYVAYITNPNAQNDDLGEPWGYTLKLYNIATGAAAQISELSLEGVTGESSEAERMAAFTTVRGFLRAGLAWSPTGRYLAFASGRGGTAGVDVFDLFAGQVFRAADGPGFPDRLGWTPDGAGLFYSSNSAEPDGRSLGAWVTTLNGSQRWQAAEGGPMRTNIIGWTDPYHLVLSSETGTGCPAEDLRRVDYRTGARADLWPGCYDRALVDGEAGTAVVLLSPDLAALDGAREAGLYQVSLTSVAVTPLRLDDYTQVTTSDRPNVYFATRPGEGMVAVDAGGGLQPLFDLAPGSPLERGYSPLAPVGGGRVWLWSGDGLYASAPGEAPRKVMDEPAQWVTPSPTRAGLVFVFSAPGPSAPGQLSLLDTGTWGASPLDPALKTPGGIQWLMAGY